MRIKDLKLEIRKIIFNRIKEGTTVPAADVAATVLKNHPVVYDTADPAKCDTEYAELARYTVARDYTRKVLNEFKRTREDLPLFPGFDHLQVAYSVTVKVAKVSEDDEDESEVTIVPTEQLSDELLLERADEYDRIAQGCTLHAQEIRRYVRERREKKKKKSER